MNKVLDMLGELEELVKNLKPGTVEGGRAMPSIKAATPTPKLPKPTTSTPKIPGVRPPSKVNPVKSAQQTQNKDIKDIKLKEAQSALAAKPMAKSETVSFNENGQWSINDGDQ
jgi:hypothetical protein